MSIHDELALLSCLVSMLCLTFSSRRMRACRFSRNWGQSCCRAYQTNTTPVFSCTGHLVQVEPTLCLDRCSALPPSPLCSEVLHPSCLYAPPSFLSQLGSKLLVRTPLFRFTHGVCAQEKDLGLVPRFLDMLTSSEMVRSHVDKCMQSC